MREPGDKPLDRIDDAIDDAMTVPVLVATCLAAAGFWAWVGVATAFGLARKALNT